MAYRYTDGGSDEGWVSVTIKPVEESDEFELIARLNHISEVLVRESNFFDGGH